MKYWAGIGSRVTPKSPIYSDISSKLENSGYILRSGGAKGADTFFENGIKNKEIFLPWKLYNNNPSELYPPSSAAYELASKFHPIWDQLNDNVKALHARNSHIVLGRDLNSPVDFVVCWTPNALEQGGTGLGLRIAKHYNIPIYNLASNDSMHRFNSFLELLETFK